MSDFIDLIGSFVVGSIVILIVANMNITINTAAAENLYSGVLQRNVTSTTDLIEHDLYKIGYRITGNKISVADSNQVKFWSDIDNDGTSDEIHYFCGDTTSLNGTTNPDDYLLMRIQNNQKPGTSISVVDFKVTYFDSLAKEIDYKSLVSQSSRDRIRSLRVRIKCETDGYVDDHFEAVEWEKTIKPKNI